MFSKRQVKISPTFPLCQFGPFSDYELNLILGKMSLEKEEIDESENLILKLFNLDKFSPNSLFLDNKLHCWCGATWNGQMSDKCS